ncbi:B41 domain-containing protein [Carpediemonas membranifera]|uniref:B41 domain-containing protein n=1 Tax=Carpediemonas membranifera TaxID=201153 RepID=A0A8J6AVS5_9EUKA|nr:B41 domain-containing protein [Carpediemonas membranifera]|eukprot:KAG9389463.1 B41 domain-containing protein [Carpediemonas membranifera]
MMGSRGITLQLSSGRPGLTHSLNFCMKKLLHARIRAIPHSHSTMSKSFIKVFLLDDSAKTMAIDKEMTAKELVTIIAEKLELTDNVEHYSLFEVKGDNYKSLLDDQKPFDIMSEWGGKDSSNKFVFKRHYFMNPTDDVKEEAAIYLLYIQALDDILKGHLYVTPEQAIQFAGINMQVVYGDHNDRHVLGFLEKHIAEFIPASILKSKRVPDWEDAIYEEHQKHKGLSDTEAQSKFLDLARTLPVYGITTYPCKYVSAGTRRIGQRVFIGVSSKGIHILNYPTMDGNGFYSYNDILSWGSSHTSFTFCTGDRVNFTKHSLETRAGKEITDQVAGYVGLIIRQLQQ